MVRFSYNHHKILLGVSISVTLISGTASHHYINKGPIDFPQANKIEIIESQISSYHLSGLELIDRIKLEPVELKINKLTAEKDSIITNTLYISQQIKDYNTNMNKYISTMIFSIVCGMGTLSFSLNKYLNKMFNSKKPK